MTLPPGTPGPDPYGGFRPGPSGPQGGSPVEVCTWHPDRSTGLHCTRCGRPACPECLTSASVGFHCRACVAESRATQRAPRTVSGALHGRQPSATYALIGLNVLVFVVVAVQSRSLENFGDSSVYNGSLLVPMYVAGGEWWRIVSSGFLHLSVVHIALNMLALYFIGLGLERVFGRWRYLAVYGLSLLGGSASVMLFAGVTSGSAGASGAIFGLMGALLVTLKRLNLDLRQVGFIIVINLVATFAIPGISWQAHLGGLVVGALVGAAMVYAPAARRNLWQIGSCVAVLVALVAILVIKDLTLAPVVCEHTFSTRGSCVGPHLRG